MLSQYDKATARLLAKLFWGSSRKASDSALVDLVDSVVSGAMPSAVLQKLLVDVRARRSQARTDQERTVIDLASAVLMDGIIASGDVPGQALAEPIEREALPQIAERPMSKLSQFYGIGLKEACAKLLSLVPEKQAMTAREIWDQLKAEGWTSNHSNPVHSVNDALRRRATTHKDVLLVGAGKWGKPSWYSDDELEEIRKSMGGMGGRDRGEHIERTKAGMATARQRGARLGAHKKLSDEQGNKILEMAREGASKEKIAKAFDISPASVTNYVRRSGYDSVRQLKREGKQLRAKAADAQTSETEPEETRH